MNRFLLFFIVVNLHMIPIFSQSKYPVDISYLVCDLKYSQEHGLKICEIQHGSLSALHGDLYISGNDGTIAPRIAHFFETFAIKKWATGFIYQPLQRCLTAQQWNIQQSLQTVEKDATFLASASLHPTDSYSIHCYAGIVYADFDIARNFSYYSKKYPGILFMNAATFPYWNDKYKMNALFNENDELKQYKADWKVYPTKYDPCLAQKIHEEMPCKLYVIKPINSSLANGVIVVEAQDLDTALQIILQPLPSLEKHPDKKYAYWSNNKDDNFLIETYYESDFLCFSLPLHENISNEGAYHYDATMRLVFILQYDNGQMTYHCLGGFWKLPSKALEEQGTLNEKRISYCKPPFYKSVDKDLLEEVNTRMKKAMLLLYEIMLSSEH